MCVDKGSGNTRSINGSACTGNTRCPYCSVEARQMGMLGMDVDPPLEEGRLWELDRRTHAKEAIFSIIDKLVDIAIADGESTTV